LSWALFLVAQSGLATDESEHCHVAWLIGHEHQKPIRDFFQHHQPLLWDVLQLYFRLGAQGPEVLYFGRALVLFCAGLSALAFFLLAGRLARRDDSESPFPWLVGALSLFPLIVFSLIFCKTLVIRPETISTPLFLFSLILWLPGGGLPTRQRLIARTFLAGVLAGAAVYTSPRFIFLGPAFFLLPSGRSRLLEFDIRRLLVLGAGSLSFVVLYAGLMSHPLREIILNLEFAYALRPVGDGYFESAAPLVTLTLLFSLLLVFLSAYATDRGKKQLLCQSVFGLYLLKIVLLADWPYMHEHHFLFVALWFGVMTATIAAEFRPNARPPIPSLFRYLAAGAVLLCLANLASDVVRTETIVDRVQLKRAILARINRSDRVLFGAAFHPICALDASYYNNPIGDCPGRLATAVRRAQSKRPLPDCDYVADIRTNRPAVVDLAVAYCLENTEMQALEQVLKDYDQVRVRSNPGRALVAIVYVRKTTAPVPRNTPQSAPAIDISVAETQRDRTAVLHGSAGQTDGSFRWSRGCRVKSSSNGSHYRVRTRSETRSATSSIAFG
jgi:hypothetical protein